VDTDHKLHAQKIILLLFNSFKAQDCFALTLYTRYRFYNFEEIVLPDLIWKKPVVTLYRERYPDMETEPFAVIKTKKVTITQADGTNMFGSLEDFFTLMGDADYLLSPEGENDKYILCWFDDTEEDVTKDLRRLSGVTFTSKVTYVVGDHNKRTYNASFKATQGKLK
jgi:hypothetical protein